MKKIFWDEVSYFMMIM